MAEKKFSIAPGKIERLHGLVWRREEGNFRRTQGGEKGNIATVYFHVIFPHGEGTFKDCLVLSGGGLHKSARMRMGEGLPLHWETTVMGSERGGGGKEEYDQKRGNGVRVGRGEKRILEARPAFRINGRARRKKRRSGEWSTKRLGKTDYREAVSQ